jgi:hypothetical protein
MKKDNALARCLCPEPEGHPGLPRETAAGRDGQVRLSGQGARRSGSNSIDKATGIGAGARARSAAAPAGRGE